MLVIATTAGCAETAPANRAVREKPVDCHTVAGERLADVASARATIDDAARATTRSGGAFVTQLQVRSGAITLARARLTGRRSADGSSRGHLAWSGAASLLAPDLDLRIVDNSISLRRDDRPRVWQPLGSASGVALDVGRELLMHPFLLRERSANGAGDSVRVALVAPAAALRDYATNERQGPVTELLRRASRLRIEATTANGRLVSDRFVLATQIPAGIDGLEQLAGRRVVISGITTRPCPS